MKGSLKTSELTGHALDWAVAKADASWKWCHELYPAMTLDQTFSHVEIMDYPIGPWGTLGLCCVLVPTNPFRQGHMPFQPSSQWDHCGRLIDKYKISFGYDHESGKISASIALWRQHNRSHRTRWSVGQTHMEAACRAIVAAKIGDWVNIPEPTDEVEK